MHLNPVLEAKGLSGGPEGHDFFRELDLRLPAGVCALVGDEGVGKTTLLRLLAGDLPATGGQIHLRGSIMPWGQVNASSVFWRDLRLPEHDLNTPRECWAAWQQERPSWQNSMQQALVDALQMAPHLDKRLNMLSTGSRRKVGLIAALASGATVTLLDQPFVSLDQTSIQLLKEVLTEAGAQADRTWLLADYEVPEGVPLNCTLTLTKMA